MSTAFTMGQKAIRHSASHPGSIRLRTRGAVPSPVRAGLGPNALCYCCPARNRPWAHPSVLPPVRAVTMRCPAVQAAWQSLRRDQARRQRGGNVRLRRGLRMTGVGRFRVCPRLNSRRHCGRWPTGTNVRYLACNSTFCRTGPAAVLSQTFPLPASAMRPRCRRLSDSFMDPQR